MNLTLDCSGFENELVATGELYEGVHYRFRFQNGYGASVIKHDGSYGSDEDLWELAVIKYDGESDREWGLTYDTEITDDVKGWLTNDDVLVLLNRIKAL